MNLEKKVSEPWRLERKFPFQNHQISLAKLSIQTNPALFTPLFSPRWVHNIYFDSLNLNSFHENINGNSDRIKTRIRWYQDPNGQNSDPHLEFKIKNNLICTKKTSKLDPGLMPFFIPTFVKNNAMIIAIKTIKDLHATGHYIPILHNYYLREYYISANKKIRLTLDTNLSFENLNGQGVSPHIKNSDFSVIELKFSPNDANEIMNVPNCLPFRLDKFSKFIEGVKLLNIQ